MANPKHRFPFKGTISQLAAKLGVSRTHLAEVLNGTQRPGGRLAFAIEEATRGKIKAKDLITNKTPERPGV